MIEMVVLVLVLVHVAVDVVQWEEGTGCKIVDCCDVFLGREGRGYDDERRRRMSRYCCYCCLRQRLLLLLLPRYFYRNDGERLPLNLSRGEGSLILVKNMG